MSTLVVSNIHSTSINATSVNATSGAFGNSTVNTVINSTAISISSQSITRRQNRIINGAMMISQENGNTAATSEGYYPVDQFYTSRSHDGVVSIWQKTGTSPKGSPNRLHCNVTSTDTSIGAGQYQIIRQLIEGLRTADLQWGTANAQNVILRFGAKGPAGTYCVAFRNADASRSYIREFTLTANTDTEVVMNIPGDTSGTWSSNTSIGIQIAWSLAIGSTYQTTANTWAAGNYFASSNQFNLLGTVGNSFELFDVGLYANPNGLDIAPEYEVPLYEEELIKCHRYYVKESSNVYATYGTSATYSDAVWFFPQAMRAAPTVTGNGSSTAVDSISHNRWISCYHTGTGRASWVNPTASARL